MQLPCYDTRMAFHYPRKSNQAFRRKYGIQTVNKVINLGLWDTKFRSSFIR